jgi:hypothetical protein
LIAWFNAFPFRHALWWAGELLVVVMSQSSPQERRISLCLDYWGRISVIFHAKAFPHGFVILYRYSNRPAKAGVDSGYHLAIVSSALPLVSMA